MSRYLILILLNSPLILAGLIGALVDFKTRGLSRNRFILNVIFWLFVLGALVAAQPIYVALYTNHLTTTSSMNLFEVIEFTAIIYLLFVISRIQSRLATSERRLQNLHQELSIRLSEQESIPPKNNIKKKPAAAKQSKAKALDSSFASN